MIELKRACHCGLKRLALDTVYGPAFNINPERNTLLVVTKPFGKLVSQYFPIKCPTCNDSSFTLCKAIDKPMHKIPKEI